MEPQLDDVLPFGCLRKLVLDDAEGMLEWMHDPNVSDVFAQDFQSMSMVDVERFIASAYDDLASLHFAISGEDGEYLGTVSLKSIDKENGNAEYAISTRSKAHGSGIARRATEDILDLAFNVLGLHRVYLDVKESNGRAVSFYRKIGFVEEGCFREHLCDGERYENLLWFGMTEDDHCRLTG